MSIFRGPVGRWRRSLACLLLGIPAGLGGCETPPDDVTPPAVTVARDQIDAILAAHRERVARLDRIHVSGTVGVEWPDAEGDWQSEQVSVRVWVDGRFRTAARFLIGFPETDLFWFGSDEERAWLFDLASDETSLCSWRHDARERPTCADAVLPAIGRPLSTADLLFGAVPLADDAADRVRVATDGRTITLDALGRQEPVRLTWRVTDGSLVAVSVLDAFGEPWALATHAEPATLAIDGLAVPLQPRLATRVVVRDREGQFTARFTFDLENTASLESQRWTTLFNLGTLRRVLRPQVVSGDVDGPGGA